MPLPGAAECRARWELEEAKRLLETPGFRADIIAIEFRVSYRKSHDATDGRLDTRYMTNQLEIIARVELCRWRDQLRIEIHRQLENALPDLLNEIDPIVRAIKVQDVARERPKKPRRINDMIDCWSKERARKILIEAQTSTAKFHQRVNTRFSKDLDCQMGQILVNKFNLGGGMAKDSLLTVPEFILFETITPTFLDWFLPRLTVVDWPLLAPGNLAEDMFEFVLGDGCRNIRNRIHELTEARVFGDLNVPHQRSVLSDITVLAVRAAATELRVRSGWKSVC